MNISLEWREQDDSGGPHLSDCAVYNAPAMEPGPCDCGLPDELERVEGEAHMLAEAIGIEKSEQVLEIGLAMRKKFVEGYGWSIGRVR